MRWCLCKRWQLGCHSYVDIVDTSSGSFRSGSCPMKYGRCLSRSDSLAVISYRDINAFTSWMLYINLYISISPYLYILFSYLSCILNLGANGDAWSQTCTAALHQHTAVNLLCRRRWPGRIGCRCRKYATLAGRGPFPPRGHGRNKTAMSDHTTLAHPGLRFKTDTFTNIYLYFPTFCFIFLCPIALILGRLRWVCVCLPAR
jgi:hypothetical protein